MDVNDVADLLGRTEACLGMEREHLLEIAKAGAVRVAFEGESLTTEGATGTSMLLLLDGTAEVLKCHGDGEARPIAGVSGGALLGEMALLDSGKRGATVRATSPARYFEIEKSRFDQMLGDRDRAATRLLLGIARALVRRQRAMNERLIGLVSAASTRTGLSPEIDEFLKDMVIEIEM